MVSTAVIGLGLIGSAALRYLAESHGDVIGIGPAEPADRLTHTGVYASHHDQGRITRILDPDPVWGDWAAFSIAVYGDIERRSGIRFHHAVGCLRVSDDTTDPGCSLDRVARYGEERSVDFIRLADDELRRRAPYLRFGDDAVGLWEAGGAGYINPRSLVAAQLELAGEAEAIVVRAEVIGLRKIAGGYAIDCGGGRVVEAEKVLVAAGAWTNRLLKTPLDLRIKRVSVVLAEVDDATAVELAEMPSIIYRFRDHPALQSIYALPPIRYPNGKRYVKIGGTLRESPWLAEAELDNWFKSAGHPVADAGAKAILRRMIPALDPRSVVTVPCVVTHTSAEHPILQPVDDNLFVAAGGCGSAAKSSNEIGRLAAEMLR